MSTQSHPLTIQTRGRGVYELTRDLQRLAADADMPEGICHVFIHHTSASLIFCENADPGVLVDLERFLTRLTPDGDSLFDHSDEGPDDMPAHVRTVLTNSSVCIPLRDGRLDLGTWQGVFLYEHRQAPHRRRLTVSFIS